MVDKSGLDEKSLKGHEEEDRQWKGIRITGLCGPCGHSVQESPGEFGTLRL